MMNKNLFILIAAFIIGLLVGALVFSGEDNKENSNASEETENEIVDILENTEQEGDNEIEPVISMDEAIKRLFAEKYNKKVSAVTININKETENHIRGTVRFEDEEEPGNSGIFLAAKVYDNWELVFDGQGAIYCGEMEEYNFPEDMIEDCAEINAK
jgi:hypothetical protein